MQHLVCGDIVQYHAHSFGGIQAGWHWHEFMLWQANELRIRAGDRQGANNLTWFNRGNTFASPIHHANEVPTWRKGDPWGFRMNTLARHQVWQCHTGGQNPHAHLAVLWLGDVFFDDL